LGRGWVHKAFDVGIDAVKDIFEAAWYGNSKLAFGRKEFSEFSGMDED
jgi:hypothetical protein